MADTLLGGIVINEILVDPNGANNFDTDGNGTASATDEYIELFNSSGSAIDISGVQLWDAGVGNWFTFPPGSVLASGAHAMVMTGVQAGGSLPTGAPGDLFFDAGRGSALINNGGDNVTVYDPGSNEFIQATFNGDTLDDPTAGGGGYAGFPATATRSGSGEDFGSDNDGFSIQRGPDGSDTFVNDETPTPGTTNICFTDGAKFAGPNGPVAIEALRPGDLLVTCDRGLRAVRWIWSRKRSVTDMRDDLRLRPVRIRKGALGGNVPAQDISVSQHHRVLVSSKIAERMFGQSEILVPAKDLIALEGVDIVLPDQPVTYFHILMPDHEVLVANGLPAESLYLGPVARDALEPAAKAELVAILGLPEAQLFCMAIASARLLAKGRRVRRLIERHGANHKPLVARIV